MMRPASRSSTPRRLPRRRRGSVILFVLGLILLTSLLLTRFIERARTELLTEARNSRVTELREEAYSTLQVTLAVLADYAAVGQGLHSPAQGWGDPLTYADYTPPEGMEVHVEIDDESGKLSLPTADAKDLQALLVEVGCLPSDAEAISDAILTWTRKDHPAQYADSDDSAYLQHDPALVPPHKALRTFGELRLMPAVRRYLCDETGNWNETGRRFLQSISLFAFNQVNLNTASSDVLTSLGLDGTQIVASRQPAGSRNDRGAATIFYSLTDAGPLNGGSAKVGVEASCLRINIDCRLGSRTFRLSVVAQPGGTGTQTTAPPAQDDNGVAPRTWASKNIDSAFRILEIRENHGL